VKAKIPTEAVIYQSVAIIVPCRNEEKYITRCLDSILHCDYPMDKLTVFVCDGMSSDNTPVIIQDFCIRYPNIHLLQNERRTTQYALNLGVQSCMAEVIIILGAHAEIAPDFIIANTRLLKSDSGLGCTGGVIENVYEDNISKVISLAMSSAFGVGNAHFRTGSKDGYVDTVAFGAYRGDVFAKAGLFDEDLVRNQDDEFNFRVIKSGYKILLDKSIRSKYYVRASFRQLYKQYFQYGYWKVYVNRKHKTVTTLRQIVPMIFVLFLLSGIFLPFLNFYYFLIYLSLLSLYLILAVLAAINKTNNIQMLPGLVYSFFILHCSYGLGYLEGIFRFFILNKRPGNSNKTMSR
jgi:glycosyltransferase involved in cell wall biosynthesis